MDGRSLLSGMAIGAALALAFDSEEGARRRAEWRGRLARISRTAGAAVEGVIHDVSHRATAVAVAARARFLSDEVDDGRLLRRVRSRVDRVCSYPDAVVVSVSAGTVTLHGPVLAGEVRALLAAAAVVRGVHAVVNDLDAYDTPEGVVSHLEADGLSALGDVRDLAQVRAVAGRALVGVAALAAGGLALTYARK